VARPRIPKAKAKLEARDKINAGRFKNRKEPTSDAALGRSKFRANRLDPEPRSLIGCDTEPVEVVLDLRAQMLKRIGTTHENQSRQSAARPNRTTTGRKRLDRLPAIQRQGLVEDRR